MRRMNRVAIGVAAGLALLAAPAAAQVTNGQVHGVVTDQQGGAVPGVTVTLESAALIRPMVEVTVASGRYEFPIVPIGTYAVSFELTGFKKIVRQDVIIQTGFRAEVNATLEIGVLTETLEFSGAPPLIDTGKTNVGAVFTREVMDAIPTARDPWQIVNMSAGVETSALNVGSARSGQQLSFTSRGQGNSETMWNVEGATITDMAATGASPTYYDFDSFQEIQVVTGGGDASIQTSGININLVTRSGSNVFKGSGRIVYSDHNMQSLNVTEELFDNGAGAGSPLKYYREWGGEAGGPIARNQAWWWLAGARQDINGSVLGFYSTEPECQPPLAGFDNLKANQECLEDDLTFIYNINGKVNYQLNSSNKFQFLYTYGNKTRNARGALNSRSPESVWRQTGYGPGNFNLKHTWVATNKLVFDSLVQHQGGGFNLIEQPEAAGKQRLTVRETGFVSRGLYTSGNNFVRPTTEVKTDSSYFFTNVMGGDHTTKFGVRYRNTPNSTFSYYPGDAEVRVSTRYSPDNTSTGFVCLTCSLSADRARLLRPNNSQNGLFTYGAYIQDSYTRGRLRLNLGVRWDYQNDEAKAGCVPENPILPDLLPAQCFDGADRNVNFNDISPRISATYNLLGTGKTVLKAGFAQYFGQGVGLSNNLTLLGGILVTFANTVANPDCWVDRNGDFLVTREELDLSCVVYPTTFDPETQLQTPTLNEVDPNLKNNRTTEFTLGMEHEVVPNVALGVNYVNRRYDRFRSSVRIGETANDWVPVVWSNRDFIEAGVDPPSAFGLPTNGWIWYEFDRTKTRQPGVSMVQNSDQERRYSGVDLTLTKRFADDWMMNVAVTLQETVTDPIFCFDCTGVDKREGVNTATTFLVKLNGMYALPAGWNASANLELRQGGNRPITFNGPRIRSGGLNASGTGIVNLGGRNLTAYDFGTQRVPTQHLLDAQLAKSFDLRGGQNRLNLIVSVFNVLNASTVIAFRNNLNATNFGEVQTILAPRVVRIQASITF